MNLSPDTSVLITGASGTLGWAVARRISSICRVIGTYFSHDCVPDEVTPARLNLADEASINDVLNAHRPVVIVHAAAMTDPDDCERDPKSARAVNVDGSARLFAWAGKNDARVIFISTDLVFDGTRGPYAEADEALPLSVYGRTKLHAERMLLGQDASGGESAYPRGLARCGHAGVVIRSSLIYGWGSPVSNTFFSGLHATLRAGGKMRLFTDQMRNPVLEDDIAGAVVMALEHDLAGLYHVGGGKSASRYDFGRAVCEVFGLDEGLVEPITMDEFEYVAGRPLDSTLDISKFRVATGFTPLGIREGLRRLKTVLAD